MIDAKIIKIALNAKYNKLLSDVYVAQAKLDKLIAKRDALFNKIDSDTIIQIPDTFCII